ncbi:MAG: hypothetical protein JWR54_1473, partial [Mucilaginibacter sp.]|nr:hypothetical protein [Mucilaginibacter sp.]
NAAKFWQINLAITKNLYLLQIDDYAEYKTIRGAEQTTPFRRII